MVSVQALILTGSLGSLTLTSFTDTNDESLLAGYLSKLLFSVFLNLKVILNCQNTVTELLQTSYIFIGMVLQGLLRFPLRAGLVGRSCDFWW